MSSRLPISLQDILAIIGVVVVAAPEITIILERNDVLIEQAEKANKERKRLLKMPMSDATTLEVFELFLKTESLADSVDNIASFSSLFGYGNIISAIVVAVAVFLSWLGMQVPGEAIPITFSSSILLFFTSLVVNRYGKVRGNELTRILEELTELLAKQAQPTVG
jgi:hypothetical protein